MASASDLFDVESVRQFLANALGDSWPTLASYVGFDEADCSAIVACDDNVPDQAEHMLTEWRKGHGGGDGDMMRILIESLKLMKRYDLLRDLGEEILDDESIRKVAQKLGQLWPELAPFLDFDIAAVKALIGGFPDSCVEQARQMMLHWIRGFTGDNPVEHLARALISIEQPDIAQLLGPLQRLPACLCGNSDPLKFRRYFSKKDDGQSCIIGICCSACGQEWLEDRFLATPDYDKSRPAVRLNGVILKRQLDLPSNAIPAFQVNPNRTAIEDFGILGKYLKIGDHITWKRPYIIWHHAIVSDIDPNGWRVRVIHWSKIGCGTVKIMESWLDLKKDKGNPFCIDYSEAVLSANPAELVIARARSRLNDVGYGLFGDNCEAFASYCKTGLAESSQVVWLYQKFKAIGTETLIKFTNEVAKAARVILPQYTSEGAKVLMQNAEKGEHVIKSIATLKAGFTAVEVGLVFAIEGIYCLWDLSEIYKNRKDNGIERKVFIESAAQRVSEAFFSAGFVIGGSLAGEGAGAFAGAAIGTYLMPGFGTVVGALAGAFIGNVVGGVLGSFAGKAFGSFVGPPIGRALAAAIGTNDRSVVIEELNPGDQVVFFGNLLHPRHHGIVVSVHEPNKQVTVVHNTYEKGVVEEEVDFKSPVYRLIYEADECHPPDEVIRRARSKINDDTYKYSLARNNCKDFARWCKRL